MQEYETTIGLEIHVQLKTKSKMFCGSDNMSVDARPNTNVCPVCMGFPGTLPVPNVQAIEWTILLGLALGSEIPSEFSFERKNYFYPDLPKAYQISSATNPPVIGGSLKIYVGIDSRRSLSAGEIPAFAGMIHAPLQGAGQAKGAEKKKKYIFTTFISRKMRASWFMIRATMR